MSGSRKTGVVKWYNNKKKFGFITDDSSGEDCFVHVSEIKDGVKLEPGQQVTFDTVSSVKGLKALNVQI